MDNIIEKVKKLLAMAERGTEHEAAIAAAKTQSLLMQHSIDLSQIAIGDSAADEQVHEWLLEAMSRRQIWKGNLAHAIAEANFCQMWWLGPDIKLVGKEHNAQIARHLYSYLVEAVERVTKAAVAIERQYHQDTSDFKPRAWAHSFRLGCTHRLCHRLQEQKQRLESEGLPQANVSALTCIEAYQRESAAIAQWMVNQNIQIGGKVRSQTRANRSGYQAGKAAGDCINLNRQLSSSYSNRLLGGDILLE